MMDRVVTTRRLHDALLVAYQPTMSSLPTVIFIQPMQTCVHHHHEAVGLHYSFVHSASLVFIYRQRYMDQTVSRLLLRVLLVAYQPTVSIIPRNNNIHHRMHANVCSECRGWWSPLVSIHDDDVFVIKHTRRGGGGAITTTTTIMMMRTTTSTTTTTTTLLCPKSTWTQIKWSQIHLNVLIPTKFPYIASTPTCKAQL